MVRVVVTRIFRAGVACMMLAGATLPSRAGDTPKAIADEIWAAVAKSCKPGGAGPAYDLDGLAAKHFEPELATGLKRATEELIVDFDVLYDGQDCAISSVKVKMTKDEPAAAIARAEFRNAKARRKVDLVFAKSAEAWKVTDVTYGHRQFSLRATLNEPPPTP